MRPGTADAAMTVPAQRSLPGPLSTPHILLIDPDWETLDHIGHVLGKQGFGVTRSAAILDGQDIKRLAPDVIVITADFDHAATAPGVLQASLLNSNVGDTPLIYTTSSIEVAASLTQDSLLALTKPFTPDALLRMIDSLMVDRIISKARTAGQTDRRSMTIHQPSTASRPPAGSVGARVSSNAAWSEVGRLEFYS